MSQSDSSTATIKLGFQVDKQTVIATKSEFEGILTTLEKGLGAVWKSAEHEFDQFMTGMAQDVNKTWEATEKAFGDYTKSALKDSVVAVFQGEMDQVEDIWGKAWDGMAAKVEGLWDKLPDMAIKRAMTGAENMFKDLVWKPVSDWFTGLFSSDGFGIFDIIPAIFGDGWAGGSGGLLKTMAEGNGFLDSWLYAGLPGYEALAKMSSWADSLFSGEGLGALQSGAASLASHLGLDSLSSWLGGGMGSNAEIESMFFGNEAAGFSWGTAAGVAAPFAIWEAGSLLSGGGIPSLTEVPGLIYEGIFGGGDSMTPEEAVKNWEGTLNYMTKMTEQMQALGLEFDELQQGLDGGGFALFGQSAQEAAQGLEQLHTVAGYSQEQIDALVASLDPLTQEFLASGQAANDLGGLVSGLVQEMNAATESYNLTSGALNNYNQYIDSLAQRLGLSGEAARSFREQIWDLAAGFSSGGEEAERFDQALNEFVSHTLGSLTEGAEDGTAAIKDLIDSLSHARGMGEGLVGLGVTGGWGGGETSKGEDPTPSDSTSKPAVVIGEMHGGGYVMGWPKAHAGALISSLARDEVPLIARRGEYVVRAEAVTATTLPALKALNQGAAAATSAAPAVNLHVEIHGNLLGSRDNLEDLARLLEGKLRELDRGRWKA